MHTARFKLEKQTLAIGYANGKRVAITIPAGDIVKLIADPIAGDNMVDVLWEGRIVAMQLRAAFGELTLAYGEVLTQYRASHRLDEDRSLLERLA